jgi:hypothetical protein
MTKAVRKTNLDAHPWQTLDRFVEFRSRWLTVIGEHLQDEQGQQLEYWRVEKADSAIVLPIDQPHVLLPHPSYRPGVGKATLDFPGGRVPQDANLQETAQKILCRELSISPAAIAKLEQLNPQGWEINSSFSNQKLYGFVAELVPDRPESLSNAIRYPISNEGIQSLLADLTCLQCRAVLQEWLRRQS